MSKGQAGTPGSASRKGNAGQRSKKPANLPKGGQLSPYPGATGGDSPPDASATVQNTQPEPSAIGSDSDTSLDATAKASTNKNILFRLYSLLFYPSRNWRAYLLKQIPLIGPSLVLMLLGFKELPKNVPLFDIFSRFPIATPIIGGVLLLLNIAAMTISFGPEPKGSPSGSTANPGGRPQLWKIAAIMSMMSFLFSSSLLAVVLVRPPWCPSPLCQPVAQANPNAVHDENLELSLIDVHHISFVMPGDPANWSSSNLPEKIDAVRLDRPANVYQVILGVRNLQSSRYELLIEKVSLVIERVDPVPYPLNVWNYGSPVNYTTNPYLAVYNGQQPSTAFAATYVPVPYAHVHLAAYENDELNVQVTSKVTAFIRFRIQVTYSFANESKPRSPLLLSNEFDVVFSDAKNWHEYQIQGGEFVPSPSGTEQSR